MVGDRESAARGGIVGAVTKVNIVDSGSASLVRVLAGDGLLDILELGRLDKNLSTHASVNARGFNIGVVVVEDVGGTESNRGATRANVGPLVVGVGNVESAGILISIAVRVANKRVLVVIVEVGVRHGNPVGGVGNIEETIVEVLAVVSVGGEVAVVDPDVGGGLDANGIAIISNNLGDGKVTDDDVGDVLDVETDSNQRGASVTNNGLVRANADLGAAGDLALDNNDVGLISLGSRAELGERGNSGGGATRAASSSAVGAGVANVTGVGDGGTLGDGAVDLVEGGRGAGNGNANDGGQRRVLGESHDEC